MAPGRARDVVDRQGRRENHHGSKSRLGTQVAATLYTILETANLHDIDPAADVHAAVIAADRGEVLLPWEFAAAAER